MTLANGIRAAKRRPEGQQQRPDPAGNCGACSLRPTCRAPCAALTAQLAAVTNTRFRYDEVPSAAVTMGRSALLAVRGDCEEDEMAAGLLPDEWEDMPGLPADKARARRIVAEVLRRRPERDQRLFRLLYYEELNSFEAAEVLSISAGAVRMRKQRLVEALGADIVAAFEESLRKAPPGVIPSPEDDVACRPSAGQLRVRLGSDGSVEIEAPTEEQVERLLLLVRRDHG